MRGAALGFVVVAAALGWALLGVRYLPMADLPQHAAQIADWSALARGDATLSLRYELNFLTPYLGGYTIARALSALVPLPTALALAVAIALLATPLAVARELRLRGADPLWAIALVPLGFTMVFYWGLFNFLVGLPLVPWLVGAAARQAEAPTPRRALGLCALALACLGSHVLLFAFATTAALAAWALSRRPLRAAWPLVVGWPLAAAWAIATRRSDALAGEPAAWHLEWVRLLQLPREVAGLAAGVEPVQLTCAALLITAPLALGARPSRRAARWAPPLIAALLFLFLPFRAFGNACLYPRFAALIAPLAWLALDPAPPRLSRLRALVPMLALVALASLGLRLRAYDAEARELDPILGAMQPGRRALGLCFAPVSAIVAAPTFEHLPMWYEASGRGLAEPSFASRYPMLVRFRQGVAHAPTELDPRRFRADAAPAYDYYVVRARLDVSPLFTGTPARLVAHQGAYWLYAR